MSVKDPQFAVVARLVESVRSDSGQLIACKLEGHDKATPAQPIELEFWRHPFVAGAWLVRHHDRCIVSTSEFDAWGRRLGWGREAHVITANQLITWFWQNIAGDTP